MPYPTMFYMAIGEQQWGYQAVHGNAEQEFSLPIAFTNNPYTVAISTTNTGNHAACKGFTLSTITLDAGDDVNVDDNIGFIILGKQQWGDIVDGTNTFTVAFTSFCKIANAGNYSWGGVDNIIRSIELTYFTATYSDNSYPFLYIAIGQQQWGFNYEVKSNNPFNLPIAFSETIFCVVATSANIVSVGAWWYKDGATLDKIAIGIGADDTPATGNFTYLSLGKQQWGYKNVTGDGGGHLLTTINFPVAYAEVCYTVNANIVVTNSDYDIDKFIVIGGITLSLFKATVDSETTDTEKTFKVNWLAIGQQQNKGQLRSLYWYNLVLYPPEKSPLKDFY